ncbi:MAG: TonB-dependent receptor [Mediterranea sp.]|jgi:TonB-linked SusC/RagA family outer membrane protein|nr:TonB-dependent receptor [Mediterranea sp.]
MKKNLLLLFAFLFVGIGTVTAQTITVQGVVTSADDGLPVIGASVLVEGTTLGTVTNADGRFVITNVPNSAKTLKITYIGMVDQTVTIRQGIISVTMQSDSELLDDVLIIAYGTAKKESFTGSASTVSAKTMEKLQVSNVSKALEGAAPGVQVAMQSGQPGSSATIRIRGIGSINSSADPLYVVDGMPFNGNIASINPADIESMTVLKDAASTSLYGARAANGVIMITTKKGNAHTAKVTLDVRLGVNTRGIPEYDVMKDPGEYMTTYWQTLKNTLGTGVAASDALFGELGYNPYRTDNNSIVDSGGNLTTAPLKYYDDWGKEAINNGMRQEYTVTVQGGSEKSNHYLSLGYLDDEGIITNTDYTRFSARANGDFNVNKFIKLNGSVSYSRGEQNSQAISSLGNYVNTFSFIQNIAPIYPVFAYDASGKRIYNEDGSPKYDFGNGVYGTRAYASNQNVVASDRDNKNQYVRDDVASRFGATISFLNDFKFEANLGYDLTNTMQNYFQNPTFGDAEASGGRGYKYRMRTQTLTVNELLTYNKTIAEKHHIDVLVGHESYKYAYNYLRATKTKFFDHGIPEFSNAITMEDMQSYTLDHTIESFLGRLNYDYADKYYFSGSLRADGSSRFAKDNRWGTFWSVGGSWRASSEEFMQDVSWVKNLTLRASYGSVGNDAIYYPATSSNNYYAYKTQYSIANSDGAFAVSRYFQGNPDLTWETSYNMNIGLSASLFDNIINLDVEYFNKRTEDMLYNVPQPPSSGLSYISENALTMVNKGFEFSLGVNIPMPNNMRWNWTFTGTHYKNKVTDIPEDKQTLGITHDAYYNIREGKSVWDFYYYKYAGVDETGHSTWYVDVKDEAGNVTGEETTTDYTQATKYYIGTALPDFQGGISTEFSWGGFDLSIATNYQLGGKIFDSMYADVMHAGEAGANWHRDILGAWREDNTSSNIPVLDGDQNANTFSDRFLIGADFFNLRNITLGYTFPKKWLNAATITNARLYVVADNVALVSKRQGLDPRQYIYGQSLANYSAIRSFSVGLSLTF